MTNTTFCIDKCVANFATSVGSGANMTKHYVAAINYVIEKRDTTPITRMYQAAKRRGDAKTATLILSTFSKVFIGAEATRKKRFGKVFLGECRKWRIPLHAGDDRVCPAPWLTQH